MSVRKSEYLAGQNVIMSGQLVTGIAAYDNVCEFPATIPAFAHYRKQMG